MSSEMGMLYGVGLDAKASTAPLDSDEGNGGNIAEGKSRREIPRRVHWACSNREIQTLSGRRRGTCIHSSKVSARSVDYRGVEGGHVVGDVE